MELTKERKAAIDSKSYEELLRHLRFAPIGDPWFEGETGEYWLKRMKEILSQEGGHAQHIQASKKIGWD